MKNWKNRGKKKTGKTGEKTQKHKKLQEIQKRGFGEVSRNAENGNEFGNEFGNESGNEFEVFSNVTKRRFEGKNKPSSHP